MSRYVVSSQCIAIWFKAQGLQDDLLFPGSATLQDVPVPDRGEALAFNEQCEVEYDSSDYRRTDLESHNRLKVAPPDENAGRGPAGPTTLWGILMSDAEVAERDKPDLNTMIDLWRAAGYDCSLPPKEEEEQEQAFSPVPTDIILTNTATPIIYQAHQSPDSPLGPYTIAASPDKGLGVFASLPLTKGSLILSDTPILAIQKPYTNHSILRHFESLPLPTRLQYMTLFCPDRSDDAGATDVVRIFDANSFAIGTHAAIFLTATRFNHSCLPNSYYSWNTLLNRIELHTMVDVPRGEELTICYCHPFLTREERIAELRMYNFRCGCPACDVSTPFGQESEARRFEMRALEEWVTTYHEAPAHERTEGGLLPVLLRLVALVKEESLHGELMNPYRDLADHFKAGGDFAEALVFARLELEEEVVCLGEGSEVVRSTRGYIVDLEAAAREGGNGKEEERETGEEG